MNLFIREMPTFEFDERFTDFDAISKTEILAQQKFFNAEVTCSQIITHIFLSIPDFLPKFLQ